MQTACVMIFYIFRHGRKYCEGCGFKLYNCAGADYVHVNTMIRSIHDRLGQVVDVVQNSDEAITSIIVRAGRTMMRL